MLWYVFEEETKRGPFAAVDIREMLREGTISLDTPVMREGSPVRRRLIEMVEELTSEAAAQNLTQPAYSPPAYSPPVTLPRAQGVPPAAAGGVPTARAPQSNPSPPAFTPAGQSPGEDPPARSEFGLEPANQRNTVVTLPQKATHAEAPSMEVGELRPRGEGPWTQGADHNPFVAPVRSTQNERSSLRNLPTPRAPVQRNTGQRSNETGRSLASATSPALPVAAATAPLPTPTTSQRPGPSQRDEEIERLRTENERLRRGRERADRVAQSQAQAPAVERSSLPSAADAVAFDRTILADIDAAMEEETQARPLPLPRAVPMGVAAPMKALAPAGATPRAERGGRAEKPERADRASRSERIRSTRDTAAPEHQRPRAASEASIKLDGAKIEWGGDRRLNSTAVDSTFAAPATTHMQGKTRAAVRGRTPKDSRSRRKPGEVPLFVFVVIGCALLVGILFLFSRKGSHSADEIADVQEARVGAERVAKAAIERAEAARRQAQAGRKALERRQERELRKAEERARRDAMLDAKKRIDRRDREAGAREALERAQEERAREEAKEQARGRARAEKERDRAQALAREVSARSIEEKKALLRKEKSLRKKEQQRARTSAAATAPAPGWPSVVLSTRDELKANGFKVVSVVGVQVAVLPSAGCSPCQTKGFLSDGTVVTLASPSFTPFVPARMAGASRVALKGLVQPKPSGEIWILVQSAIKN